MSLVATDSDPEQDKAVTAQPPVGAVVSKTNLDCLKATYSLLSEFQLATPSELAKLAEVGQQSADSERQHDPLEVLVQCRGVDPDEQAIEIERLGRLMGTAMQKPMVLPPFAARLPTPSAFYDSNPEVLGVCQDHMTPILFAEEAEVIGVGSINPIAIRQVGERIVDILGERTGTNPIISPLLLTLDGWLSMCNKQLGI
jgi:hypothetical protein